jgi:hypothetical protein
VVVGAKQALRRLLQKQILLPFCGCSPPLTKRHTTVPTHRPDSSDSLGCQKRRMRVEVEVEGLRHLNVRRRFLSVAVVCRIALLRFASPRLPYCIVVASASASACCRRRPAVSIIQDPGRISISTTVFIHKQIPVGQLGKTIRRSK